MGAGKTSLLADKYLEGAGNCTVILPEKCLKRHLFEGMNICSRNGKMVKVDLAIDSNYNLLQNTSQFKPTILVDEIQFLTRQQHFDLSRLSKAPFNFKIFGYGLRNNFNLQMFKGSEYAVCVADQVAILPSRCSVCEKSAVYDSLVSNDNDFINATYASRCIECFMQR